MSFYHTYNECISVLHSELGSIGDREDISPRREDSRDASSPVGVATACKGRLRIEPITPSIRSIINDTDRNLSDSFMIEVRDIYDENGPELHCRMLSLDETVEDNFNDGRRFHAVFFYQHLHLDNHGSHSNNTVEAACLPSLLGCVMKGLTIPTLFVEIRWLDTMLKRWRTASIDAVRAYLGLSSCHREVLWIGEGFGACLAVEAAAVASTAIGVVLATPYFDIASMLSAIVNNDDGSDMSIVTGDAWKREIALLDANQLIHAVHMESMLNNLTCPLLFFLPDEPVDVFRHATNIFFACHTPISQKRIVSFDLPRIINERLHEEKDKINAAVPIQLWRIDLFRFARELSLFCWNYCGLKRNDHSEVFGTVILH